MIEYQKVEPKHRIRHLGLNIVGIWPLKSWQLMKHTTLTKKYGKNFYCASKSGSLLKQTVPKKFTSRTTPFSDLKFNFLSVT